MNKQTEALKMAIEWKNSNKYTAEQVIEACKEALEEAENPELVAVQYLYRTDPDNPEIIPLYTHPATWHSLSDDEIDNIWSMNFEFGFRACARAIEQALKELNAKK